VNPVTVSDSVTVSVSVSVAAFDVPRESRQTGHSSTTRSA